MRSFTSIITLVGLAFFAISFVSADATADLQEENVQGTRFNPIKHKRYTPDEDEKYCDDCDRYPDRECEDFCGFQRTQLS